uniref:Uncharacterized protein n=1 Tax=Phytophthora ramorum TaxID=164328 RepID=H3H6K4_PHYRM
MRVRTAATSDSAAEMAAFSEYLLKVGEGRHEVHNDLGNDYIKIPRDMLIDNPAGDPDEDEEIRPGAIPRGKVQGQTVQYLGLYLATPCFSHGQLYVAISRVTSRWRFKALVEYPEREEEDGEHSVPTAVREGVGSDTYSGGERSEYACGLKPVCEARG